MLRQLTPLITKIDYITPPWYLRLRWWVAARIWCWGRGCDELSTISPELANPLWYR